MGVSQNYIILNNFLVGNLVGYPISQVFMARTSLKGMRVVGC
jgi:hypothetical protein